MYIRQLIKKLTLMLQKIFNNISSNAIIMSNLHKGKFFKLKKYILGIRGHLLNQNKHLYYVIYIFEEVNGIRLQVQVS